MKGRKLEALSNPAQPERRHQPHPGNPPRWRRKHPTNRAERRDRPAASADTRPTTSPSRARSSESQAPPSTSQPSRPSSPPSGTTATAQPAKTPAREPANTPARPTAPHPVHHPKAVYPPAIRMFPNVPPLLPTPQGPHQLHTMSHPSSSRRPTSPPPPHPISPTIPPTIPSPISSSFFPRPENALLLADVVKPQTRHHRKKPNPWELRRRSTQDTNFIVNLSSHSLSTAQRQLLNKGLGYVTSQYDYSSSIEKFTRTLKLQEYFNDSAPPTEKLPPFRKKSTWTERLEHDISHLPVKPYRPNLTKAEDIALKELKSKPIIIRQADKGSCVVVEDRESYIKDGTDHLADTDIYREVEEDLTSALVTAINTYAERLKSKGFLSSDMADFLTAKPEEVRTQQLYFLRKTHKVPMSIRPIVSGTGGLVSDQCGTKLYRHLQDGRITILGPSSRPLYHHQGLPLQRHKRYRKGHAAHPWTLQRPRDHRRAHHNANKDSIERSNN